MKNKIYTIAFFALFAFAGLHAQTEKGRFLIGGASSVDVANAKGSYSNTSGESTQTTISIKPEVGYFLFDDFSVGLSASLLGYTKGDDGGDVRLLSEFKYFFQGTNFRPFVKANVGYRYKTINLFSGGNLMTNEVHGLAFGGGVGGAFFVKNNISIDLGLEYIHANMSQVSPPTYDVNNQHIIKYSAKANDVRLFVGFSLYL